MHEVVKDIIRRNFPSPDAILEGMRVRFSVFTFQLQLLPSVCQRRAIFFCILFNFCFAGSRTVVEFITLHNTQEWKSISVDVGCKNTDWLDGNTRKAREMYEKKWIIFIALTLIISHTPTTTCLKKFFIFWVEKLDLSYYGWMEWWKHFSRFHSNILSHSQYSHKTQNSGASNIEELWAAIKHRKHLRSIVWWKIEYWLSLAGASKQRHWIVRVLLSWVGKKNIEMRWKSWGGGGPVMQTDRAIVWELQYLISAELEKLERTHHHRCSHFHHIEF